jgi:hypothetical protein
MNLEMQIGYEVYVSITTYYSFFKQDTGCKGT